MLRDPSQWFALLWSGWASTWPIVDTGPYGLVRHPIYTGIIGAILTTGVALATVTALLGTLLIAFGLWQKARMEEGFLTTELGADAYGRYCRRVPMLVPFLRQRKLHIEAAAHG